MAVRAGVLFLGSCVSLLRSLGNLGAAGAAESGTPGHFSAALGAFGDSLYLADFIPAFCDLGGEGCDLLHLILGKGAFLVLVLLIVGLADGDIELVDLLFLVRDGTVQLCNLAENLGLLRCALAGVGDLFSDLFKKCHNDSSFMLENPVGIKICRFYRFYALFYPLFLWVARFRSCILHSRRRGQVTALRFIL